MAQLSRARDRSMHSIVATIQAEQDLAIRAPEPRRRLDQWRPGHGQDRGRAAPRGVPPLHRPAPLRERRRAGGRPQRRLHALHRAGAPQPRRGRGGAALPGRGRRRPAGDAPRRAGGGRHQGLGPDGDPAAASGAAAGARQPGPVPRLLARRRAHPRARHARPGPPAADVAGPAQPPAAPGGGRPARRVVEPGPRRARPRPGPGGVRRRPAQRRRVPRLRGRVVAAARRAHRARLAARTRPARPGLRRPAQPRGAAAADQVLGQRRRGRPVRRGRAADRRAALRARRRAPAHRRRARPRRDLPAGGRRRHAGAADRVRPRVRAVRSSLGAADAPARGRPVLARPGRRGAGPHADAVADGRPARQDRVVDDRRRPGAVVVAGPGRVRRGSRDRARGQGAARLPPLDELPELLRDLRVRRGVRPARRARRRPAHRGPLDGGRAAGGHRRSPTSSPRPARPCSTWPAGCPARSGSWCRSRVGPR